MLVGQTKHSFMSDGKRILLHTGLCIIFFVPLNTISACMYVSDNSKKMKANESKADLHGRV